MKICNNKKYHFVCILFALSCFTKTNAQQFINKAQIEYEVKVNIKKTMGNSNWAEMMKENIPDFKIGYYQLTFSNDKSIYKFDHWPEKGKMPEYMRKSDEENRWYFDRNKNIMNLVKDVWGSKFNVEDTIAPIEWRLINESRQIAGFNCRKAVGKINDSVYVFAFYTDEITYSGGPCSISGLPGTILGLTIPRMYASWIATKVIVNNINEEEIKPILVKKYLTKTELKKLLKERSKDWGLNSDDATEEDKMWANQFFWNVLL